MKCRAGAVRFARGLGSTDPDEAADRAIERAIRKSSTFVPEKQEGAKLSTWLNGFVKLVVLEMRRDATTEELSEQMPAPAVEAIDDRRPREAQAQPVQSERNPAEAARAPDDQRERPLDRFVERLCRRLHDTREQSALDLAAAVADLYSLADRFVDLAERRPDVYWLNAAATAIDGLRWAVQKADYAANFDDPNDGPRLRKLAAKPIEDMAALARNTEATLVNPSELRPEAILDSAKPKIESGWNAMQPPPPGHRWYSSEIPSPSPEDYARMIVMTVALDMSAPPSSDTARRMAEANDRVATTLRDGHGLDDAITEAIRVMFRGDWAKASQALRARRSRARRR